MSLNPRLALDGSGDPAEVDRGEVAHVALHQRESKPSASKSWIASPTRPAPVDLTSAILLQAWLSVEVSGEEPQGAVHFECRDLPMLARVGVQGLLG